MSDLPILREDIIQSVLVALRKPECWHLYWNSKHPDYYQLYHKDCNITIFLEHAERWSWWRKLSKWHICRVTVGYTEFTVTKEEDVLLVKAGMVVIQREKTAEQKKEQESILKAINCAGDCAKDA